MVSRRLLPIWRRLPDESTRVYRLQSDDGERVIGRRVSPAWAASVANDDGPVRLSGEEAMSMLMSGEAVLHLAQDQKLQRVRAMHDWRLELTGFHDMGVERVKAMGLLPEIVAWTLRLSVPVVAVGAGVGERTDDRGAQ